jgi:hypothetical protein
MCQFDEMNKHSCYFNTPNFEVAAWYGKENTCDVSKGGESSMSSTPKQHGKKSLCDRKHRLTSHVFFHFPA